MYRPSSHPSRDSLQRLVDALAQRLRLPVVLDDPDLRPIAHSPQLPEEADRVRTISILARQPPRDAAEYLRAQGVGSRSGPIRIPAHAGIGLDARLCQPVIDRGRTLGFLWVLDGDGDDPGTLALLADVAEALAAELGEGCGGNRERDRERLQQLLGPDPGLAHEAAAALIDAGAYPHRTPTAALAARLTAAAGTELGGDDAVQANRALRAFRRDPGHHPCITLAGAGEVAVVIGARDGERLDSSLPRAAAALREHLLTAGEGGWAVSVGIGSRVDSLAGAAASHAEAAQAAVVAARIPQLGDVLPFAEIGIYRILLAAGGGKAPTVQDLPASVRRLVAHSSGEALLHTLETYLDNAGDAKRTTAALFLARGSLYYRLRRIEEIAEADLRCGEDRLTLHLGLKLARIAGAYRPPTAIAR